MAYQFQTVREDDLGGGIDQQSAENKIRVGYSEDIENADPRSTGQVRTRVGYQGFAGYVPIRVKRVTYTDDAENNLCFFLDGSVDLSSIDLTNISSSPLVAYGRTSEPRAGDFSTTDSVHYYPKFKVETKKTFEVGTGLTIFIPKTEHTLSTPFMFVQPTESTSLTDNSNEQFEIDEIEIDKSTFDVTLTYTNNGAEAFDGFVVLARRSASVGTTFVGSDAGAGTTKSIPATGLTTTTISLATHGLSVLNVMVEAYEDTGTTYKRIETDEVRILSSGDVEIDINNTDAALDVIFIVHTAPATNVITGTIASGATATITVPNIQTEYPIVQAYLEPSIGADLESVEPDSVIINSEGEELQITFTNGLGTGANFEIYYDWENVATNKLCVTGSTITTPQEYDELAPQITLWGLPHADVYGNTRSPREGWVNHVDSYRSVGEDRLICGLGGNLFAARERDEGTISTDYLMDEYYPSIRERVSTDVVIGPAFFNTTDAPSRTRGYIKAAGGSNHFLNIESATYQSGTGYMRYTITATSLTVSGTPISVATGLEDELTVQSMGFSKLNGVFKIRAVTYNAATIDIDVENSGITSSDFDELDAGGLGGVFTDQLPLSGTSPFIPDDKVSSAIFTDFTVARTVGTTLVLEDNIQELTIPGGLRLVAKRSTNVVPLRDFDGAATIDNLVRGDMLKLSDVTRLLRTKFVRSAADVSVTIIGDGSTAEVTLSSGDTNDLAVGQSVLIKGATNYNGAQTIVDVPAIDKFTFNTTFATTEGATLVGKTVEFDETLTISDTTDNSVKLSVTARWIPIESPDDSFDLTPLTTVTHFDSSSYTNQNILRSTMVQDNLYFVNGEDEVMKFDGTNVYRAGLFRWQPHLFVTTDTSPPGGGVIVLDNPDIPYARPDTAANRFTVGLEDQKVFPVGTKIEDSRTEEKYTIIDTDDDGTDAFLIVNKKIDLGSFSSINTVTSATSGSDLEFTTPTDHNLVVGDIIEFSTTGTLPDNIEVDTPYYVAEIGSVTTFKVSTDPSGVPIVGPGADDAGTGTHSIGNKNPTLTQVSTFKYYFRLNAVDANDNVVASAVTGAEDFVVEMSQDAAVRLRLIGMPAWHIYDYDRLEVQIYRTQSDQVAPFYRLTTLPMEFDAAGGYIDYVDTDSDEDLLDLDEVNTALAGAELGTGFSEPLRAKYCTSADNRLILSNITDYPTLDLRIIQNASGPITISDFTTSGNEKWLFRRSNIDAFTATNMDDRINYEFVSSSSTVVGITGTAGTSFSVEVTGHGLSVGDWVYLFHSSVADGNLLTYAGWWQVASITDVDNFVINFSGAEAGAASDFPDKVAISGTSTDVPVFLGDDGNYSMLNGNRTSTEPYEFLAMRRMANAINASMRKVDTTLSGFESFTPWLIANAGNEFNVGQLIVRRPKVEDVSIEVEIPALTGAFDLFVNDVRRSASSSAGAITRLFPSRTLISFPNFPEIFDSPTTALDFDSRSAVDVNSADGQEITSVIPFFGDAAFGSAQKSGIVVVFKENSIYLMDVNAKAAGQPAIQKIESEGKGCTAPFSVATTKTGIMFANFSGIYRLTRDLRIEYIGRKYERIWREEVNRDLLSIATGHHFAVGNRYKLSVPVNDLTISETQKENNEVCVYNHTREYEGKGEGSWATYTQHPATGWANLLDDAYFGTTDGQVFSIRRANDVTDYRDDDRTIPVRILLRPMDFGNSGSRKIIASVISHFRTLVQTENLTIKGGLDMVEELNQSDSLVIIKSEGETNLSDFKDKKVLSVRSTFDDKIGMYIQLAYEIDQKDEPISLTGVDFRVSLKKHKGITEAADTVGTAAALGLSNS